MSVFSTKELSYDPPASTVTRAQGGFSLSDTDVIDRWVQLETDGTIRLVADGETPLGKIARLGFGKVAVSVSGPVRGKRGTDAVIPNGKVVGATRQESATGSAERGFIRAPLNAADALKAVGRVSKNSAAVTTNTPAGTTTVLL